MSLDLGLMGWAGELRALIVCLVIRKGAREGDDCYRWAARAVLMPAVLAVAVVVEAKVMGRCMESQLLRDVSNPEASIAHG